MECTVQGEPYPTYMVFAPLTCCGSLDGRGKTRDSAVRLISYILLQMTSLILTTDGFYISDYYSLHVFDSIVLIELIGARGVNDTSAQGMQCVSGSWIMQSSFFKYGNGIGSKLRWNW
jgi:hypothetical protein